MEALEVEPGFWAGRRVLVTGHTGFKGSWLVLWLQSMGAGVAGFSTRRREDPCLYALAGVSEGIEEHWGDIRDADAVRSAVERSRPEVVLHLAAQPLVRRSYRDPIGTYASNVLGTAHVLEAVRVAGDGVRAVVNVTTDKVYENNGWDWGYRENEPLGGADPYSSSKACSEIVTAAYRQSFFSGDDGGARVASARAGNVIGGGDFGEDRLVPDVMRAAAAGETVVIRNPHAVRPWQHVLNPIAGYLLLAQRLFESGEYARAWNFGPPDADALPVGAIVDRLAELWPEGIERDFGSEGGPHEAATLKLDSSLARNRLRWTPRWDLDRALRAIVDWHLVHRDGGDVRAAVLDQVAAYRAEG